MKDIFDIAIIGGGINGCGIARDAAGRGMSVCLLEQGDLAGATSSASTKLIHGGLRYLEFYEFGLVRKALREREVLWSVAPHIIHPLRFVLPHSKGQRPAWLLRLGLFLYDHLGGRKRLPATRTVSLARSALGAPLKAGPRIGFTYSDCAVDDARLVILNAVAARESGASVRPRTRCVKAAVRDGAWDLTVQDTRTNACTTIRAKALINAAGPWVSNVLETVVRTPTAHRIRMVKGSHIVVRRMFEHDHAYIFQNFDGRIVFAIPYEDDFTLIGTTDEDIKGDPSDAAVSAEETAYLCRAVNHYFKAQIRTADIVHEFCGVRPLYDDNASSAHQATRDYVLKTDTVADDNGDSQAPLLNIFGGKITTYRKLAEHVLEHLAPYFPAMTGPWTASVPLPGGDFPMDAFADLLREVQTRYPFLPEGLALRLTRAYGREVPHILGTADTIAALGKHFGAGLYEAEVRHLIAGEWAQTLEDILWRRTKLGLHFDEAQKNALGAWLKSAVSSPSMRAGKK